MFASLGVSSSLLLTEIQATQWALSTPHGRLGHLVLGVKPRSPLPPQTSCSLWQAFSKAMSAVSDWHDATTHEA